MNRVLISLIVAGFLIALAWPSAEGGLQTENTIQRGEPEPEPTVIRTVKPEPESAVVRIAGSSDTVLEREANGHFYAQARINGREPLRFLVDTGATVVALTLEDARRLGIFVNPAEFQVVGQGASGPVRGKELMLDSVEVDGKRVVNVRAVVLEGLGQSLLGQAYLSRMSAMEMSGDYMVLK